MYGESLPEPINTSSDPTNIDDEDDLRLTGSEDVYS